jgi:hypothetical protein
LATAGAVLAAAGKLAPVPIFVGSARDENTQVGFGSAVPPRSPDGPPLPKCPTVRAPRGRLRALSVLHSKSSFYSDFVWVHRALNSPVRRFLAWRAVCSRRGRWARMPRIRLRCVREGDGTRRRHASCIRARPPSGSQSLDPCPESRSIDLLWDLSMNVPRPRTQILGCQGRWLRTVTRPA